MIHKALCIPDDTNAASADSSANACVRTIKRPWLFRRSCRPTLPRAAPFAQRKWGHAKGGKWDLTAGMFNPATGEVMLEALLACEHGFHSITHPCAAANLATGSAPTRPGPKPKPPPPRGHPASGDPLNSLGQPLARSRRNSWPGCGLRCVCAVPRVGIICPWQHKAQLRSLALPSTQKKCPESCCTVMSQPCRMLDTITCRCRLLTPHVVCFRRSKPAKVAQAPDTTCANPDATATTTDTDTAAPTQASCGGIVFFSHTA